MAKNKPNMAWLWIILTIVVAGGVTYMVVKPPVQQTVIGSGDGDVGCLGLSSVDLLFNDFNSFKSATDPASHVTVYEKNGLAYKLTLADDAISGNSVSTKASFKGVVGTNAGTPIAGYFSELVSFATMCEDIALQTAMKPSGNPTITIVNDDGITKNTDANHESMGASSTYLPTLVIKSASESCSARHGAFLIADYDATYFSKLSTSDLRDGNTLVLLPHNTVDTNIAQGNMNATNDQFKVWLYEGELCDGAKTEPQIKVETTSTQPTEDINVDFYWLSRDIDVNADDYNPLSPAIYDEDNNAIYDVKVNATLFGA